MTRIFRQFLELWKQLGLNQKVSLVLASGVVVAVMAAILLWSSRPDMQLLSSGLDPKEAGEIVSALDAQGIPYELSAGGTSIHVPRQHVYRVRMDFAGKGLPTGGVVGFEIFDRGNFGISDFVQRTNYLRAIQGELGRTIGQLDGVRSARVMVVMPENRLLVADSSRRSTASVLVDTGGRQLMPDAVNSIRSLVANAVEGLKLDDVVVVDNGGNVLSEALRQDGIGGLSAGQIRYRRSLEEYFGRKVETMLATVLGPGNAVVRVSVDVDTSSSTTTEETFNPDGQVLRNSTVTDDTTVSSESGSGIGGAVGEVANTPSETGAAALGSASPLTSSQQKRTTKTESYEIARSTTRTERTAGEIRRIAAAVFVAARTTGTGEARQVQPRNAEEVESIRRMVVTALGVVPPRGQTLDQVVTVQEVDFAPDPVTEELGVLSQEFEWRPWFEVGRNVLFALLALGGFVYFVRLVRRSQAEAVSFEVFNSGENGRAGELQGEVTPDLLNEMIRQRPDNVSITLKRWMSADQK